VVGPQVPVPKAHEAFAADGSLADERVAKQVRALAEAVTALAAKLRA
jgi:hypothetical protein